MRAGTPAARAATTWATSCSVTPASAIVRLIQVSTAKSYGNSSALPGVGSTPGSSTTRNAAAAMMAQQTTRTGQLTNRWAVRWLNQSIVQLLRNVGRAGAGSAA